MSEQTVKEFRPVFFVGMPSGSAHPNQKAAEAFYLKITQKHRGRVVLVANTSSSLCHNFNILWSAGLNFPGVTHFGMLHDDVVPAAEWWIDVLYDEMVATNADVVSAVNAIKDGKGLTTTGVACVDDEYDYRRLTTKEVTQLPPTFGYDDLPDKFKEGREVFLINTGCWIADVRKPWWREMTDAGTYRFCFQQHHRISFDETERKPVVEFAPEDWLFSRYCHEVGAKVMATTKAVTFHQGNTGYPAHYGWGDCDTDTEAIEFHKTKPLAIERLLV